MTGSVDSLHPDRVLLEVEQDLSRLTDLKVANGTDYLAPYARWEETERKAEARAEVGYAVQAESLRKQLEQQRETFDRIVARERDAREKAEAERDAAQKMLGQTVVELAGALAKEQGVHIEVVFDDFGVELVPAVESAALARLRDTQKQEGQNDE